MDKIAVLNLDHVQLAMPEGEEAAARRFYGELLRMTEAPKPPVLASRGGCWFRAGTAVLHLGVEKEFRPAQKAHPAFCVSDIDAVSSLLTQHGYKVEWDTAVPGMRRFYTADCFENRIELIQAGHGFLNRPE
ncbi:MAG TPA: hypothetical protein VGL42_02460 [Opitutaceae bacterium]|jgi:hypothetical protein